MLEAWLKSQFSQRLLGGERYLKAKALGAGLRTLQVTRWIFFLQLLIVVICFMATGSTLGGLFWFLHRWSVDEFHLFHWPLITLLLFAALCWVSFVIVSSEWLWLRATGIERMIVDMESELQEERTDQPDRQPIYHAENLDLVIERAVARAVETALSKHKE